MGAHSEQRAMFQGKVSHLSRSTSLQSHRRPVCTCGKPDTVVCVRGWECTYPCSSAGVCLHKEARSQPRMSFLIFQESCFIELALSLASKPQKPIDFCLPRARVSSTYHYTWGSDSGPQLCGQHLTD